MCVCVYMQKEICYNSLLFKSSLENLSEKKGP